MDEHTRKGVRPHGGRPGSLGALITWRCGARIEVAVEEELTAALGAGRYVRDVDRGGYRNGPRPRTLTEPTGLLALTLPRATLFMPTGTREWTSALVPRYQRRLRGALAPLLTRASDRSRIAAWPISPSPSPSSSGSERQPAHEDRVTPPQRDRDRLRRGAGRLAGRRDRFVGMTRPLPGDLPRRAPD